MAARKNDVDDTIRREMIEARLAEAQSALTRLPRGSTAYRDGLAAVRQLERILLTAEDLPPTVAPHGVRRRPDR